jgi:hypothetical protein
MPTTATTPAEMVATIRADLERLEECVNTLCHALPYRAASSVSYATDHLRTAAHYLDYAHLTTEEPHDLDAPHFIPEDFAV